MKWLHGLLLMWWTDDGEFRLQAEVREILESIRVLKEKLYAAVQSLARLQKTKVSLENDIAVKESSLDIDRRECIGLRRNVSIDPSRGGANFSMTLNAFWIRDTWLSVFSDRPLQHTQSIFVVNSSSSSDFSNPVVRGLCIFWLASVSVGQKSKFATSRQPQ